MYVFRSLLFLGVVGLAALVALLPAGPSQAGPPPPVKMLPGNVVIALSRDVVNALVTTTRVQPERIDEVILNTPVKGCGIARSVASVEFVPDATQAAFNLVVDSVLDGRTTSTKDPVTLYSRARTTMQARKPVAVTCDGIRWGPADGWAKVDTEVEKIETRQRGHVGAIIRAIARRIYERDKDKARAESEWKGRRKMLIRVDRESDQELAKNNRDFHEKLLQPLSRTNLLDYPLSFRTTHDQLLVLLRQADERKPPRMSPPPAAEGLPALVVLAHDSAPTRTAGRLLAGKTVNRESLDKELQRLGLPSQTAAKDGKPTEKKEDSEEEKEEKKEEFEVTFAKESPLVVRFDDQRVSISLRITAFKREDGAAYDRPWQLTATYRLSRQGKGLRLDLDGEIKPEPLDPKTLEVTRMSGIRIAERRVLIRQINKQLQKSYTLDELKPTGDMAKIGILVSDQAVARDGWLLLTWRREPGAAILPTPAFPSAAFPSAAFTPGCGVFPSFPVICEGTGAR